MSTWTDQLYKFTHRVQNCGKYSFTNDTWSEDENIWTLANYDHNIFWRVRIRPKHDNAVIREFLKIKDRDTFCHNVMMLPTLLILNNLKGQ